MPLLRIIKRDEATIGLWEMVDGEFDSYTDDYLRGAIGEAEKRYKSNARRMEYICERALLKDMMNGKIVKIFHNEDGKPMLNNGLNISISHTRGYIAIILSETKNVGIDIEYVSDRVEKISSRFMREDESADDIMSLLVHWCAKETLYKLFSSEHLDFMNIKVNIDETVSATNLLNNITVPLYVESTSNCVMTYSML
jgi:4'-phosphopantetheinyl transferase EntD